MANKLLRLKAVKEYTGLSRSSIYSLISKNAFPKNISIGSRSVAWSEEDIQGWIDQKISSSKFNF
ncbi:MAG: hypothetical protein RJB18_1210 [Pseudomonadota bacterium]|jgi:prophage regulatory protein